jgi:hypothetical protein
MSTARFDECDAQDLAQTIGQLHALVSAAHRTMVQAICAFDRQEGWREDGANSVVPWLVGMLGVSSRTAAEWADVGSKLESLPAIASAYGEGRLSWDQVASLTRFATPHDDEALAEAAHGWTLLTSGPSLVALALPVRSSPSAEALCGIGGTRRAQPSVSEAGCRQETVRSWLKPSNAWLMRPNPTRRPACSSPTRSAAPTRSCSWLHNGWALTAILTARLWSSTSRLPCCRGRKTAPPISSWALRFQRKRPAACPATRGWPSPPRMQTDAPLGSDAAGGRSLPGCSGSCGSETVGAGFPPAHTPVGHMPITSCTGPEAARPMPRTSSCCVAATTGSSMRRGGGSEDIQMRR